MQENQGPGNGEWIFGILFVFYVLDETKFCVAVLNFEYIQYELWQYSRFNISRVCEYAMGSNAIQYKLGPIPISNNLFNQMCTI